MVVVCNSSPLIYLSRLGSLKLIKEVCGDVVIPKEVFSEVVVKGKELRLPGAEAVEQAIESSWVKVGQVRNAKKFAELPEIHLGEAAVLQLALETNAEMVLIDDAAAAIVARNLGLKVHGAVCIILTAAKKSIVTKKQAKDLLGHLVSTGFRLSPEVFVQAITEIDEMD